MQFEMSMNKSDELILSFLRANGYGENAYIKRYIKNGKCVIDHYGEPIVEVCDSVYYNGEKVKRLTKIQNYNKLLLEVLNLQGSPVHSIKTSLTPNGISYIIDMGYTKKNKRGR